MSASDARSSADELLDGAQGLRYADRLSEALAKCDAADAVLAEAGVGPSDTVALRALHIRALCLGELGDDDGEREALERVIKLAEGASDPDATRARRAAMVNLAASYVKDGRTADVLHLLQGEFIEWWPDEEESWEATHFVYGARLAAHAMHQVGVSDEAIELLDMLVDYYGNSTDAELRHEVTVCLRQRAAICVEIDDYAGAITTYDRVLAEIGEPHDAHTAADVAERWINRAYAREMSGEAKAADDDRRHALTLLAEYDDPEARRVKALAREILDR